MKCSECGADIVEGIAKCPFCKTPTDVIKDEKFKNFDFTYTITSKEQINIIRETVNQVSEETSKSQANKKPISVKKRKRSIRRTESSAKSKRPGNMQLKIYAIFCAAVLCLALVLFGVFAAIGAVIKNNDYAAAYTYLKENSLYLIYKGKTTELTQQTISPDYLRRADESGNLPSGTEAAKDNTLSVSSKNGRRTYYFENYDPETKSGDLKLIENGKIKSVTVISAAVHNSLVLSSRGDSLLYLQSTDKNGDMGVLYYWKDGMDEPYKIATDIDSGTFAFSENAEEALFLQNLDRTVMQGDLYSKNLKKLKEEKTLIDSNVCAVFGTGGKAKNYIYAKGYDTSLQTYNIYAYDGKPDSKQIRLGEKTKLPPVIVGRKNKNTVFVYGFSDDETNNLYCVDLKTGTKEKIAAGVNQILKISDNGKTVMYDRVFDRKLADYYIYTCGEQAQKVAGNVSVDFNAVGRSPQLAVSNDFSQIAYIGGFDADKGSGTLYVSRLRGGKADEAKQLTSDVHSCYIASDGQIVFTKDYSTTRKVFDVYVQNGNKSELLKDEISPEMFGVSRNGDNIFYISGYNVTGNYGSLERSDLKGKREIIAGDVFDFELTKHGDLLLCKNRNSENGVFDLFLAKPEKYAVEPVDSAINSILTY